jgi:transposase
MARKNYSEQFRRQVVDLYESTPGATLKGIAADLGVERATLKRWVDLHGTGKKTAADGTTHTTRIAASAPAQQRDQRETGPARPESPAARIARLEARVAELEASEKKLATEREILRQAAKYFAGRRTGEPLPVRRRPLHHLCQVVSWLECEAAMRA